MANNYQFKGVKVISQEQHKGLLEKGYYTLKDGTIVQNDTSYLYMSEDKNRVEMTESDTVVELTANTFYVFPEMASLEVSFGSEVNPEIVQEYKFRFTSGATATTLILPSDIKGSISVNANSVVEISIVDGYAVSQSWEV